MVANYCNSFKKTYRTKGTRFGRHDWLTEARNEMLRVLEPYRGTRTRADPAEGVGTEIRALIFLDAVVKAMTTKTEKIGFDTGIRIFMLLKRKHLT